MFFFFNFDSKNCIILAIALTKAEYYGSSLTHNVCWALVEFLSLHVLRNIPHNSTICFLPMFGRVWSICKLR